MKKFVGMFEFYEKNLNGDFDTEPSEYRKECDTEDEVKNYEDLLYQAIEIECFDNSEIYVVAEFTEDGEYLDRDEFVIKPHIVRIDEPSKYIKWGDKTPHIFSIDRARSCIEFVE